MNDEKPPESWGTFRGTSTEGITEFAMEGRPPRFIVALDTEADARAALDAPAMLELLRKNEWWGSDDNDHACCPECEMPTNEENRHHEGCACAPCSTSTGAASAATRPARRRPSRARTRR